MAQPSAERIADHFVNYLFQKYQGTMHVQRIASWVGLLALGIEKIKSNWWESHSRQLLFEHKGHRYKVRYNHSIKPRGGVEIIEVLAKRGSPQVGQPCVTIRDLNEAETFYRNPKV